MKLHEWVCTEILPLKYVTLQDCVTLGKVTNFFHVHESNDMPMLIKIPKLRSCWQSIYIMLNCSHVECGSHGYKSDREPSSGLGNMFSQKGRKLQLCSAVASMRPTEALALVKF